MEPKTCVFHSTGKAERLNKTTDKHFTVFKKHVHLWLDHFGLKDWEIIIDHDIPVSASDALAACSIDLPQRFARIYLNTTWDDNHPTEQLLKCSAFHEVCELMLGEMNTLAKARFATDDEIDSARHAVIARLYNSIAGEKYR